MEMKTKSSLCPLCKRPPLEGESRHPESRLCGQCQSLVETIFAKNKATPSVAAAGQGQYAAALAESSHVAEGYPGFDNESLVESDELLLKESEEESPGNEYSDEYRDEYSNEYSDERDEKTPAAPTQIAVSQIDEQQITRPYIAEPQIGEAAPAIETKVAAPDWDYTTVSEWPLAATADRGRPRSLGGRFKAGLLILIAVLIALAIIGYFAIYRPFFGARPESNNDTVAASPLVAKTGPAVAEPDEKSSDKPQQPQTANAEFVASETPAMPAPSGEGMISLQVASFPNQAAAIEYSEKLIRAGVPGYVIAADLGRRGRWFRVRVGKFASATAAEQYAAQSRERARAAGLNIQLIVCDYEKP